jgi:DNA-binding MarR family transcriptional regulator
MSMMESSVPMNLSPKERIAHLVRLAGRGFTRGLQIRLTELDVTFGHWVFLRILWEQDGISQRELSTRAMLTEPTTHKALERLEALGYVARRKSEDDQRRQRVFLTELGRDLREKLEPMALEVNAVALAGLSDVDQAHLRRMLFTIIENLQRDEDQGIAEGRKMPPTRVTTDL